MLMLVACMACLSLITLTRAFNKISTRTTIATTMMMTIKSETSSFHGLLTGFNRQSNITSFSEMYYTDKLDFNVCKEMFYKDYDILWKTFVQEIRPGENPDEVIENISEAARKFVNSNDVYNRGEIIEELESAEKGDLVILTGGPSIGKSLVLNHLFGNRQNYLYLDGCQTGSNIIKAIVDNIEEWENWSRVNKNVMKEILPGVVSALTKMSGNEYIENLQLPEILNKIVQVATNSPDKAPESLKIILELMKKLQIPIEGIIFDEANKYFTKESLPLLDLLTFLTKQDRKLTVIMATSDYGFPFALDNIGYNPFHISMSLVLSDVSPCDTLRLLSSWGVRPNLAYLLVEIYGGHVLQLSRAIVNLYKKKEQAKINTNFISGLKNRLDVCMKESVDAGMSEEVMIAFDELMSTGYACKFNDPVAELLTKCNIAGFIGAESSVPSLSTSVRQTETGVVPSVQMIRIVYSLMTYENKKKETEKK